MSLEGGFLRKVITVSLMSSLLDEAEDLAREEKISRSEFFREAIRKYIEDKKRERLHRYGRLKAMEQGAAEGDIEGIVDEYRRDNRNDQSRY